MTPLTTQKDSLCFNPYEGVRGFGAVCREVASPSLIRFNPYEGVRGFGATPLNLALLHLACFNPYEGVRGFGAQFKRLYSSLKVLFQSL